MFTLLLLFSCQNEPQRSDTQSDTATDSATDDATPELGEPITAEAGTWTWVDFPDSTCADGTPTGISVNVGTSDNLIVFFSGGGACWDALTCLTLHTSSSGPYGQKEFDASAGHGNSLLSREDPQSPFYDWTLVSVPYCTGDLHIGDSVASYDAGDGPVSYYHKGHANVLAYLKRLGATFASPTRVAVVGSSSGGAGTLLNYPDFRRYWPSAEMYLVDDAAPLLVGDAMPPTLRSAWDSSWELSPLLADVCGDASCEDDLSGVHAALAASYPTDRMALLSSLQDRVFSTYVGLSGEAFQAQLELLTTDVLLPSGTWQPFYIEGDTHSLLMAPEAAESNGVSLQTWLTQMVTDSDDWSAAN